MKPIFTPLLTQSLLLSLLFAGCVSRPDADSTTLAKVDLSRYAGVWFEAARKPTFFQKNCSRSKAEYSPLPDGSLRVVNTCIRADGSTSQITGRAIVLDPPTNARLEVRFDPFFARLAPRSRAGNYWIFHVAYDYSTAIVGTPDRKFLWILTRTEQLSPTDLQRYLAKAKALGFDTSDVIYP